MDESANYVLLGYISGVHGVKGWLKVFSYTSPRLQITEYPEWYLADDGKKDWQRINVLDGKKQGKNIIALLDGVNDRNHVEALIGTKISIKTDQLEALPKHQYYWRDLIGLSVVTVDDVSLGVVDWLFDTGSNDVLVVKDNTGVAAKERMIPFLLDDVIKIIDLDEARIIVDWDPDF